MHVHPVGRFFVRHGSYQPRCRQAAVQRYRCKHCKRHFSYQTFRIDYRDRRPECNARLAELLVSGVGLRQAARLVGLGVHSVQCKFHKLGRAARALNRNLIRRLPGPGSRTFLLDEAETFELSSILPVSVPVLIERSSMAVLAIDTAPIRRVSKRGSHRRRWLEEHERRHGRRPDHSRKCVRKMLGRLRRMLGGNPGHVVTDEKPLYAALLRHQLRDQVAHETVPGRRIRTTYNPLFPINLTEAMLRCNNGRLRRRSWLVSKCRERLRSQLELFALYRNWVRRRTNGASWRTPGMVLGLAERPLTFAEALAWRQDWRGRSIHPTSVDGSRSVTRPRAA